MKLKIKRYLSTKDPDDLSIECWSKDQLIALSAVDNTASRAVIYLTQEYDDQLEPYFSQIESRGIEKLKFYKVSREEIKEIRDYYVTHP